MMENYKQAIPTEISPIPTEISLDDLELMQGQCINNSFQVAKKYPTVEIVEGIILLVSYKNQGTAVAHMWNKLGDIHFDVTENKIWRGNSENKAREVRYAYVNSYPSNRFSSGDTLEFSRDTAANVEMLIDHLKSMKDNKSEL